MSGVPRFLHCYSRITGGSQPWFRTLLAAPEKTAIAVTHGLPGNHWQDYQKAIWTVV